MIRRVLYSNDPGDSWTLDSSLTSMETGSERLSGFTQVTQQGGVGGGQSQDFSSGSDSAAWRPTVSLLFPGNGALAGAREQVWGAKEAEWTGGRPEKSPPGRE